MGAEILVGETWKPQAPGLRMTELDLGALAASTSAQDSGAWPALMSTTRASPPPARRAATSPASTSHTVVASSRPGNSPVSGRPPVAMITASGVAAAISAAAARVLSLTSTPRAVPFRRRESGRCREARAARWRGRQAGSGRRARPMPRTARRGGRATPEDPRRLEATGAAADNGHGLGRPGGPFDGMAEDALAAGRDIVDTERILAHQDPVDAVAGADTGADLGFPALPELGDVVRIGKEGTGHADHVDQALGHGMNGGRGIGDAGGMQDRDRGPRRGWRRRAGWIRVPRAAAWSTMRGYVPVPWFRGLAGSLLDHVAALGTLSQACRRHPRRGRDPDPACHPHDRCRDRRSCRDRGPWSTWSA